MTSGLDHVTSHDPSTVLDVVEEPIDSIIHTEEPVSQTSLTSSEDTAMETEDSHTTNSSCGEIPAIRSFTPPPNSVPSDQVGTADAGSQTSSGGMGTGNGTGSGGMESGNGTGADEDTLLLPPEEEEMETHSETQVNSPMLMLIQYNVWQETFVILRIFEYCE